MDINQVLKEKEYDFIRNQERLKNHIDFLCFGGSISYGLNGPDSDVDIRGICSPLKRDILGNRYIPHPSDEANHDIYLDGATFAQYIDSNTDTCIYNINKYIHLIEECNPNTIEMLGCLPEHYAYVSDVGKLLIDNKNIFVSKRAYNTFAGYARQQFIRLQNVLARSSSELDKLLQTISIIERTYSHLEESFPSFKREMIEFYVVDSRDNRIDIKATNTFFNSICLSSDEIRKNLSEEDLNNAKLKINISMNNITPADLKGVVSELSNLISNFNNHTGHRNNKKDDYHVNKHASHLKRLLVSSRSILKDGTIQTYCGEYIDELKAIKAGKYMNPDGSYKQEFFDTINSDMIELEELYKVSPLPDKPNKLDVLNITYKINEAALSR